MQHLNSIFPYSFSISKSSTWEFSTKSTLDFDTFIGTNNNVLIKCVCIYNYFLTVLFNCTFLWFQNTLCLTSASLCNDHLKKVINQTVDDHFFFRRVLFGNFNVRKSIFWAKKINRLSPKLNRGTRSHLTVAPLRISAHSANVGLLFDLYRDGW